MKETIDIEELLDQSDLESLDDLDDYKIIDEKQTSFDSEKGFAGFETIIQRKSDNKFFKVEWTDYGQGNNNLREVEGEEVVRKEKITYYYE